MNKLSLLLLLSSLALVYGYGMEVDPRDRESWANHIRNQKINMIMQEQEVVKDFMTDNHKSGMVVCTNRTNPLAPALIPECLDNTGRKAEPVCATTNWRPDPIEGCVLPDGTLDETERLTMLMCPKLSDSQPICQKVFTPVFIPNEHAQRASNKPLLVCRDHEGQALKFPHCDNGASPNCQDGSLVDPCLECFDRSEPKCPDGQGCPKGTIATVLTAPYQCSQPYRCDPVTGSAKSVQPSPCADGGIPLCSDEEHGLRPDDCLLCRDRVSTANCRGLCPAGYVATPMPHFFCNNPYQNETNILNLLDFQRGAAYSDKPVRPPQGKPSELDDNMVRRKSHASMYKDPNGGRDSPPYGNDIHNTISTNDPKHKLRKYGGKHGPRRDVDRGGEIYTCVDKEGVSTPMKRQCKGNAIPVCADGMAEDPCIGCAPKSFYICPKDKMETICPPGQTIERTPKKYCKNFKIRCPAYEGGPLINSPIRCDPDSEPVCISPDTGLEWPIHPCGCGPHGKPFCSGPVQPGPLCPSNITAGIVPADERIKQHYCEANATCVDVEDRELLVKGYRCYGNEAMEDPSIVIVNKPLCQDGTLPDPCNGCNDGSTHVTCPMPTTAKCPTNNFKLSQRPRWCEIPSTP